MDNPDEFREGTENGCKAKMRKVFHHPVAHVILIALIVLDIVLLLVVLLVDIDVIEVHAETPEEEEEYKEKLEAGLHYAALSIISIFVVEVVLKMIIEGKHFFSEKWEVFDAVVVFVTFGLDLALAFSPVSYAVRDSVSLLIFLRLWRVVKIMAEIQYCVRKEVPETFNKEKLAQEKADWLKRRQEAHTKV
ncbi:voltage-gated hydrogen channel 1-like [Crassostrea virginica]|uniref:Voltage-gated hydrogen channel 1 n=1 Tax=Crassostrea virginica TaxID=6565 RepID=A0A8B8EUN4_CRAVI|nr:voltage-gated hydrogen channel 1-like isoform X2 [Crassostrea virginica]